MGARFSKQGETVYGTRGGPFRPGAWWASTRKGNTIYLHILAWPEDPIFLPGIDRKIVRSAVLTGGTAEIRQDEEAIEVSVPKEDRRDIDTIIALDLDGLAIEIQAKRGDRWETFATGGRIRDGVAIEFAPVTVQVVRLNVTKAIDGPTIWEL